MSPIEAPTATAPGAAADLDPLAQPGAAGARVPPPRAPARGGPRPPVLLTAAKLGACAAVASGALVVVASLLAAAGLVQADGGCGGALTLSSRSIPAALTPIYGAAAAAYQLGAHGPAVLAAINRIETNFGSDLATSSAGAEGFMQFMPATWAAYGVDANGDGIADPSNPWDAIFAAARYLRASGAPRDWRAAVLSYNHAGWYANEVLAQAATYEHEAAAAPAGAACAPAAAGGRLGALIAEADRIDALRSPYVYGGGHVTPAPATPPWDCSSAWSRLLQVAGYRIQTMTSGDLMAWGDPGPGRYVTIYATPAHVYGTIEGRPWGTSGLGSNPRDPLGGPAWLPYRTNPVPGFPGGTPTVRHPPGL